MDPIRIQCQECGVTRDARTLGYPDGPKWTNFVILFSGIEFCAASTLRRCKDCRQAAADCPKCAALS